MVTHFQCWGVADVIAALFDAPFIICLLTNAELYCIISIETKKGAICMEKFTNYLVNESLAPNTIRNYVSDIGLFLQYAPEQFTKQDVLEYRALLQQTKNATTINRFLSALKHYTRSRGLPDMVGSNDFIKIQKTYVSPTTLNEEDVLEFLARLRRNQPFRDYCIAVVIANTGLRIGEVLSIRLSHLQLIDSNELIIIGKGNKQRKVVINDSTVKVIMHYYNNERIKYKWAAMSDYLFVSNKGKRLNAATVNRIFNDNSLTITPHMLRHFFATNALEEGLLNLRQLQEQLGHSSLETVQKYTHPRRESMVKALNGEKGKFI